MSTDTVTYDTSSVSPLARVLDALPSYVNVTFTYADYRKDGEQTSQVLMSRDFPRTGRRFTNLTIGTETFEIEKYMTVLVDLYGAFEVSFDFRAAVG